MSLAGKAAATGGGINPGVIIVLTGSGTGGTDVLSGVLGDNGGQVGAMDGGGEVRRHVHRQSESKGSIVGGPTTPLGDMRTGNRI